MNLREVKEKRIKSLQNAYEQLMFILDGSLDPAEVDPEKRKAALSAYKQAAEDSDLILKMIIGLMEEEGEVVKVEKKKTEGKGLSPESRLKR